MTLVVLLGIPCSAAKQIHLLNEGPKNVSPPFITLNILLGKNAPIVFCFFILFLFFLELKSSAPSLTHVQQLVPL